MVFRIFKQLQVNIAERFAVALFVLAFLVSVFPVLGQPVVMVACVVVALVLVVLTQLCDREERPALTSQGRWVSGCVFGLFGLGVLSLIFSDMPYDGIASLGVLAVLPLSFVVALRFWGRAFVRPVLGGVLSAFAVLCVLSIAQYFMQGADKAAAVIWPIGSAAALAALLVFGFLMVLALLIRASGALYQGAYAVMLVVAFLSVLMTGGLTGLLGLFAGAALVCAVLWQQVKQADVIVIAGLCACLVAGVLLFVLAPAADGFWGVGQALKGWAAALAIFGDHLLLGTGLGSFVYYYPEYKSAGDQFAGFIAQNDVLQMTAELGILLPVLFYGLTGLIVLMSRRALRVMAADDPRRAKLIVYGAALLALFVALHGGGAFYTVPVLMVVGLVLGSWLGLVTEILGDAEIPDTRVLPDSVRMGLSFGLVLAVTFLVAQVSAQFYVARAYAHMGGGYLEAAGADVNTADRIALGRNAQAVVIAANIHIGSLGGQGDALSFQQRQSAAYEAVQLLERAKTLNPRLPSIPFSYALLSRYGADVVPAEYQETIYLREVLRLNPEYVQARMRLAELVREQGNLEAGLDVLAAGLDLAYPQQNPLAYYVGVIQAAAVVGDRDLQERAAARYVAVQQDLLSAQERQFALTTMIDRLHFWR